jgi:hypothetical protein
MGFVPSVGGHDRRPVAPLAKDFDRNAALRFKSTPARGAPKSASAPSQRPQWRTLIEIGELL